jgi:hypothetical protein
LLETLSLTEADLETLRAELGTSLATVEESLGGN